MPDLVTRVKFEGSRGHAFASVFLGRASFRPVTGEPDDVSLWGGNLSGRLKTFRQGLRYGQFTFGDGVGRYRGGVTAIPNLNNELQPVGLSALMGGYEHYWSSTLTSNAVFSVTTTPDEPYDWSNFNQELIYGAVNLIYSFLPDRAWAGVEYPVRPPPGSQWRRRHRQSHPVRHSL